MNATSVLGCVPQTKLPELKTVERLAESRQPVLSAATSAWLRRGLLVGIALLLVSLTFVVLDSLNSIEAEMEMIRASFMTPIYASTW